MSSPSNLVVARKSPQYVPLPAFGKRKRAEGTHDKISPLFAFDFRIILLEVASNRRAKHSQNNIIQTDRNPELGLESTSDVLQHLQADLCVAGTLGVLGREELGRHKSGSAVAPPIHQR